MSWAAPKKLFVNCYLRSIAYYSSFTKAVTIVVAGNGRLPSAHKVYKFRCWSQPKVKGEGVFVENSTGTVRHAFLPPLIMEYRHTTLWLSLPSAQERGFSCSYVIVTMFHSESSETFKYAVEYICVHTSIVDRVFFIWRTILSSIKHSLCPRWRQIFLNV